MQKQKRNSLYDKPFLNRYNIQSKLKVGGFGKVYLAKDTQQKILIALKLIDKKHKRYADTEIQIYQLIKQHKYTHGFVKALQTGGNQDNYFIVMELLGKDLEQLMIRAKNSKFSLKTSIMIGLQVIDRIQAFHKIGYLHRDIKPDNLTIGVNQNDKIIYLIDFGLAKKIGDPRHQSQKGKAVGTLGYMSIKQHQGKQQSPADDLESFIYTIIYFIAGDLPWMKLQIKNAHDIHRVKIMKQYIKKQKFNVNIPKQLYEILDYLKSLGSKDKIDYLKIKYKLLNILNCIKQQNDFRFDWCEKKKSPQKKKALSNEKKEKVKMAEDNQKIVQKEIYEVYKFFNEDQPEQKKKQPQNNQKQKQFLKAKRNSIKNVQNDKIQQLKRPLSSQVKPRHKKQQNPINERFKLIESFGGMKYQGPKIVINKTAKHKI